MFDARLAEGQVLEINWRATRIKTVANDIIVMPNSVIAKAVVTFAIEDFAAAPLIQSDILKRVVEQLNRAGISIGTLPAEVRLLSALPRAAPMTPAATV